MELQESKICASETRLVLLFVRIDAIEINDKIVQGEFTCPMINLFLLF